MEGIAEIQGIPRLLAQTLAVCRSSYEPVMRRTRWGSGPIYICTCGALSPLGIAASYAFEWMLGWPVIVRPLAVLEHYAVSLLAPRSVFLIIAGSGNVPEAIDFARKARRRGATVLVLSSNPENPLAGVADGFFLVKSEAPDESAVSLPCELLAIDYLATLAARTLKRPISLWDTINAEFDQLPSRVEWALTQLSDAIRSLSLELKSLPNLWVVGGGFYHAPAIHAARRLRELAGIRAEGVEASEFRRGTLATLGRGETILFVSSSRCRLKPEIHLAAAQSRVKAARVFSLTDRDDRELADRSEFVLLTPSLTEVTGSVLSVTLLEWLAREVGRQPDEARRLHRRNQE